MPFTCSICEEESTRICVGCTKDSCENHLCEKCHRCSDCCGCEVALTESERISPPAEPMAEPVPEEPLVVVETVLEPTGIPAEDVPGEAADKDIAG